jgi:hypothetical protein
MLYRHYVKFVDFFLCSCQMILDDLILLRIMFSWTLDSVLPLHTCSMKWLALDNYLLKSRIIVLLCSIISPFSLVSIRSKLTVRLLY